MRSWRSRYRMLLVDSWLVGVFAFTYAGLASFAHLFAWWTGFSEPDLGVLMAKLKLPVGQFLLFGAAVYGLIRAAAFHPFCYPAYRNWLATTPWGPGTPLPLQPVHLAWQDAVVITALTALSLRHPEVNPWEPLTVFGFIYLLVTAITLLMRQPAIAVVLLGGLPLVFLPAMQGGRAVGVLAMLYVIAFVGTRHALATLASHPDPDDGERQWLLCRAAARVVGWPFRQLGPAELPRPIGVGTCLLVSLLAGWWVYAVASRLLQPGLPPALFLPQIGLMVAVPIALIRVSNYVIGYVPAVGVLGRLTSGRLIVPGYDKIFVAPALVLFAGFELPRLLVRTPLDLATSAAVLLAACLLLGLLLGPTRSDWQLTGDHRLCRLAPAQQQQQQPQLVVQQQL